MDVYKSIFFLDARLWKTLQKYNFSQNIAGVFLRN